MYDIFEVLGRTFSTDSFPPINEEHSQNAVMIAPYKDEMYVYGWGCYNYTGDKDDDVWEWEPLYPFNEANLPLVLETIKKIHKDLNLK